jgi:hypothetical protein
MLSVRTDWRLLRLGSLQIRVAKLCLRDVMIFISGSAAPAVVPLFLLPYFNTQSHEDLEPRAIL